MALMAVALAYFSFDKFVLDPKRDVEIAEAVQHAAPLTAEAVDATVDENSIAVLPFVNMSSDPEQEYFSDGLSEELLNLLAKIPELKVAARTSSFSFKGQKALRYLRSPGGLMWLTCWRAASVSPVTSYESPRS